MPLQNRSVTIGVRVTADENELFKEAAKHDKMRLSEWLRILAIARAAEIADAAARKKRRRAA